MTSRARVTLLAAVALAAATSIIPVHAQQPDPSVQSPQNSSGNPAPPARTSPGAPAGTQVQTPFSSNQAESPEFTQIVNAFVARENQLLKNLRGYSPRVETYIQNYRPDPELGGVPVNDHYFLGRIDFRRGIAVRSFLPQPGFGKRVVQDVTDEISRLYSFITSRAPSPTPSPWIRVDLTAATTSLISCGASFSEISAAWSSM